ncbi:protein S100-P-like [Ranitomeya variabilis]|uniref:protein S100-P-like n=1 Tax=Ranitomeya variabilis TaxID=490064 RepID=UPI00405790A8
MSELATAIDMLTNVYNKYSNTGGKKNTLTKGGMKTMLEKDVPVLMANAKEKDNSGKLLKDLFINGEAEVDFKEFINILSRVLITSNE